MGPLDPHTTLFNWKQGLNVPGVPLLVVFLGLSQEKATGVSIRERPNEVWQSAGMHYDCATSFAAFGVPLEAQDHRESAGGPPAMRILRSLVNTCGRRVLIVNDCLTVVSAMQKGSISLVLQADAEYMARAGLEVRASLMFLHVPDMRMIEEGVYRAGRRGAQRTISQACSPSTRKAIQALCAQQCGRSQLIFSPSTATSSSNASPLGRTNRMARSLAHSPSDPGISPGENEGILESAQVKMRVSGEAPGASSVRRARHRRGRQFKRRVHSSAADHNCPFRRQL